MQGLSLLATNWDNTSVIQERQHALRVAIESGQVDVHTALDYIQQAQGGDIDGRYKLDPNLSRFSGGQAAVAVATSKYGGTFAIKFFSDHETFVQEAEIYKILVRCSPTAR